MQPAMTEWALARLGQTLINLIGDSWAVSNSRPKTRASTEPRLETPAEKIKPPSIPTTRRMPLGFLFDASKSENVIRELLGEFRPLFNQKFGELMCHVHFNFYLETWY